MKKLLLKYIRREFRKGYEKRKGKIIMKNHYKHNK